MVKGIFCPICNSHEVRSFKPISGYWFCFQCRTAWVKSFPKVEYGEGYYKGKSGLAGKLFSPIASFFYMLRIYYVGFSKKNVWLDVGAGDGVFLSKVNASKKIGVEVSSAGRKRMKSLGIETMSEKRYLKSKELKAEIISFWHVLEHVEKPWEYLKAAKSNLKVGGKIVVAVPNIDSLEFRLFKGFWFHLQKPYHLWHFSIYSICRLMENAGFKIVKRDSFSLEHHFSGVLQSFINRFARNQNVLQRIIKRNIKGKSISQIDVFWSIFWLTAGLPIIILFWLAGSIFQKPGTVVVVGSLK